jgi:hypothetical protein
MSQITAKQLKEILKQINEPNEFILTPFDLTHPSFWIWKAEGVRIKPIFSKISGLRREQSRWDVFINGQYIAKQDFENQIRENDLYIFFKRANFPPQFVNGDLAGQPYQILPEWEVKIKGDLELVNK